MWMVDAPWPQPMSATRRPVRSPSSMPSIAGIHAWVRKFT